ncbi:MAG: rhodanese-like domain-containing protein [Bacteroidales bacterium]|nr:rhodanese-like domain-containing protein [Bacteroidales bacterium]
MKALLRSLVLIIFIVIFSCLTGKGQEGVIEYLYPEDFIHTFRSESFALLLDTRKSYHYRKERIEGAINVKDMNGLISFADTLDREIPIYIYCDGVSRSISVAEYLKGEDFVKLIILAGGIREWKAREMDLNTRRQKKRTNLFQGKR